MNKNADMLATLVSFSIRAHFYKKAELYARCGVELFPDKISLVELYAYTLILNEQVEKAWALLRGTNAKSVNLAFLMCKCALLLKEDANLTKKLIKECIAARNINV